MTQFLNCVAFFICVLPWTLGSDPNCNPLTDKTCTVDGGWSDWVTNTDCTSKCGPGVEHQVRACNNPVPLNGGHNCNGSLTKLEACVGTDCPRPALEPVPVHEHSHSHSHVDPETVIAPALAVGTAAATGGLLASILGGLEAAAPLLALFGREAATCPLCGEHIEPVDPNFPGQNPK